MKIFLGITLTLFFNSYLCAQETVGFLLDDKLSFPAFTSRKGSWSKIGSDATKKAMGKILTIYYNGTALGEASFVSPYQECFKIYSAQETKKTKGCPSSDELSETEEAMEPTGPCPGDLGDRLQCPKIPSANIKIVPYEEIIETQVTVKKPDRLSKAFSSTKSNLNSGVFTNFNLSKRPLLLASEKVTDPEGWSKTKFDKISKKIKKSILNEALKHRETQKCTNKTYKEKNIKLTEKDLSPGITYKSKKGDKYAVSIKVKAIKSLAECNGDEAGIPSAYVIYQKGKASDLLKKKNWKSRDLQVLEILDVNKDGQSEIFFIDYQENQDGFSLYDFKLDKLIKNGSSSQ